MELNYTKQNLLDLFLGAKDLVLKTITAKQVMMGTTKRGKQIINNSDRFVEITIDGVQYLGNGYLFIKKGIDKKIDALFEKYSDMVSAYEYKGIPIYNGKKEDYELVTEIDLRTEQTLLKTNKTTQLVLGDSKDKYHAYINSHYYRYFEKIIGSIRLGTPVQPVHMFDKNDEYIGSICPVRHELQERKRFFHQPTMEEFLRGQEIEKTLKDKYAKEDIEDKINQYSETLPKRAEILLEQCKDVVTSELKVIRNKKGWYGIGFDTIHKDNKMEMEIFGEKDYKEYLQFWEKSHSKELAERLLEKINNNTQEEKKEEKEMTQQYNKTQVRNVLKKLASRLEKMEVRTEDAIMEMVYDVVPKAFEIEYNKEDNYIFFYVDADYTGKQPSKKELLKIDSNFKKLDYVDSFDCFIQETDEKYILSADTTVCYYDNDYEYHTRKATIMEFEIEKEGAKEIQKHLDIINEHIEIMEYFVYNIVVNTNKENCVYAVIENKYGYKNITGLYAGEDGKNESIELAKKLAEYYEVEVIDACGMDVSELANKQYLDILADLDKPCEMVSIKEKLGSLLNDEDKYMVEVVRVDTFEVVQEHFAKNLKELENLQDKLYKEIDIYKYYLKTVYLDQLKEGEMEVMTENKTTIVNEDLNNVWTCLVEKVLKKIANKKEHGLTGVIKIVDVDLDRVTIVNSFGEDVTIRMWDAWETNNKKQLNVRWTMFRYIGDSHSGTSIGEGKTIVYYKDVPEPTEEKKQRMENRSVIFQYADVFFNMQDAGEMGMYLKDIGINPKYAENGSLRNSMRFLMYNLMADVSSENKIETKKQAWDLIKDDTKVILLDEINEGKFDKCVEESMEELPMAEETNEKEVIDFVDLPFNEDDVEVTLRRNKDNKSVKMSDYVKHGLDEFEDKQTGSLVITPAQMKEKTWQGLTVESAVEDLLKENKEYECKLFNEKHIKEPHYVVYRKNTKSEEVDVIDTTLRYTLNKAINSLEGKVEKFEELMDEMDNLMVSIENLSPMANVMPIMDMEADLFQSVLDEDKDLQSFKKEIQNLAENTDLFKYSDYDDICWAITYEECSCDCYENSLKRYVEELKSIAVNLLDDFLEDVKETKKKNEVELVHNLETLEDVAKLIKHTESGLYTSVTNEGEDCAVLIQRGEGMELQIRQQNGWIRVEEYDKEGHKTLETFNGRWKK